MRALIVSMLTCMGGLANAAELPIGKTVDLGDRQALERLANERPNDFAKIRRILREVGDQPPERVTRWMKTSFDAEDARYGLLLQTSDPPKAELSFVLDGVGYRARITLRNVHPQLIDGTFRPQ